MRRTESQPAPAFIQVLGRSLWGDSHLSLAPVDPSGKHEQYLALPSVERARFLLPASLKPAAAARLLREYNALRTPAPRLARAMFASAAGRGIRLTGGGHAVTVAEEHSSLREFAAELLDRSPSSVALACGVRVESGLARPTVTVVDCDGQPVLYLKIAVAPLHRRRLHAEHEGLQFHAEHPLPGLEVPRPLGMADFGDREVLAVTPLPRDVRRIPSRQPDSFADIQRRFDSTSRIRARVADSEWLARIQARLGYLEGRWADLVQAAIGTVVDRHGDAELNFGVMHGDWTPWNCGHTSAGLALWDWEFFTPSAPEGLEAITTEHLIRTTLRGDSVAGLTETMRVRARGQHEDDRLLDLFLLDMGIRRAEEAAAGYARQIEPATTMLEALKP